MNGELQCARASYPSASPCDRFDQKLGRTTPIAIALPTCCSTQVDVDIDSVKVTHRKWEQTQDADSAAFFKFRWGLQLVFDRRMRSLLQASVSVLDFEFGPSTSEERKRVVAAVLKPWLGPGVLYKRMWAISD